MYREEKNSHSLYNSGLYIIYFFTANKKYKKKKKKEKVKSLNTSIGQFPQGKQNKKVVQDIL